MFAGFEFRKKILFRHLPDDPVDIHTHLLPGVDDGAADVSEGLDMVCRWQAAGVKKLFCTPHIQADRTGNRTPFLYERFLAFRQACPPGVELRLAGEYMLDECFISHLEEGLLTFDGRQVLLEVSYLDAPADLENLLYEVALNGYRPVLAHPERYLYMRPERYESLKERGCRFQLNLLSVAGYYGREVQARSRNLLRRGWYDYAGSDLHRRSQAEILLGMASDKKEADQLIELIGRNRELWG